MHYYFYFLMSCFESFEFLPCQGTEITMFCVYSHVCSVCGDDLFWSFKDSMSNSFHVYPNGFYTFVQFVFISLCAS